MGFSYGILGAGRQGTAAAYDLIARGDAERVEIADVDLEAARASASRVNALAGSDAAVARSVNASDPEAVESFVQPLNAFLSAASYRFNVPVTLAAIRAGTHMCDLGGNMDVVRRQLDLDGRAKGAGVCIVPDCGEAPGMANNLAAYAASLLDRADEIVVYDGGIPEEPRPPWNYELTFNVDGLTNEYQGTTTFIREGRPVEVDCLDSAYDEVVDFGPPFGKLEAFVAATGSTVPLTLGRRLRRFESKVLRYRGHVAQFRAFRDLGLFGEDVIDVGSARVAPRDVFHVLLEPRIAAGPDYRDVVLARAVARGDRGGSPAEAVVDFEAHRDDELGFTAMQRSTGWHAATVLWLAASGQIAPGATPVELAVEPARMVGELRRRGFDIREDVRAAG